MGETNTPSREVERVRGREGSCKLHFLSCEKKIAVKNVAAISRWENRRIGRKFLLNAHTLTLESITFVDVLPFCHTIIPSEHHQTCQNQQCRHRHQLWPLVLLDRLHQPAVSLTSDLAFIS